MAVVVIIVAKWCNIYIHIKNVRINIFTAYMYHVKNHTNKQKEKRPKSLKNYISNQPNLAHSFTLPKNIQIIVIIIFVTQNINQLKINTILKFFFDYPNQPIFPITINDHKKFSGIAN